MAAPKGHQRYGGRSKGIPNKTTAALKEMILAALGELGGQEYLQKQAKENPSAFMTLLGKVLPMTVAGDPNAPIKTDSKIEIIHIKP